MPIVNNFQCCFIVDEQKWFVRFTPHCFIIATPKTKLVFDYPDNKLPIYKEDIEINDNNKTIIGIFKTDLYTMYVSSVDNLEKNGSIDMVGMLVDKLLP